MSPSDTHASKYIASKDHTSFSWGISCLKHIMSIQYHSFHVNLIHPTIIKFRAYKDHVNTTYSYMLLGMDEVLLLDSSYRPVVSGSQTLCLLGAY